MYQSVSNKLPFLLTIIFIGIISNACTSQAGLNIYAGITNASNKNELISPSGYSHNGFHIGGDAILNEGKMYFQLGAEYHSLDFLPSSNANLAVENLKYAWIKFRVGLGYKVIKIRENIYIKGHSLVSLNLVNGVPTDLGPNIFTEYNSGTAGANLGLGFELYNFSITAAYEIGFFNLGNMLENSEMNFLTFSLGYRI